MSQLTIFIGAFLMIFFAEMGDKSQLMAISLSSCYKIRTVISGIVVSIFISNGAAVLLGSYISNIIDFNIVTSVSSVAFLIFGVVSLIESEKIAEENVQEVRCGWQSFLSIALLFTVAEVGDKTQLATAIYTAKYGAPFLTFIGVFAGMLIADALGIYLGYKMRNKISQKNLKLLSSIIFFFLGSVSLITSELILMIKLVVFIILFSIVIWHYRIKINKVLTLNCNAK